MLLGALSFQVNLSQSARGKDDKGCDLIHCFVGKSWDGPDSSKIRRPRVEQATQSIGWHGSP